MDKIDFTIPPIVLFTKKIKMFPDDMNLKITRMDIEPKLFPDDWYKLQKCDDQNDIIVELKYKLKP